MPPTPECFADALLLTGPTGSGKTAVALAVAEAFDAEIVAADSMTVYRHMDIGTAKPTAGELARVRHHLVGVLDPWESANVAWWLAAAAAACRDIRGRGKRPLFVGGTPFYLKALLCGLFDGPPSDPALRAGLEAEAERDRAAAHARLQACDPRTAARLHVNDVRRVARALEVFTLTGRPISDMQQTWDNPSFTPAGEVRPGPAVLPCVILGWPRPELCARIDRRVQAMVAAGWLDEVRRLGELPRPMSREASQALGYPELRAVLRGEVTLAAATAAIQTRTRQFAKRQMTWFRGLRMGTSVDAAAGSKLTLRQIAAVFGSRPRTTGDNRSTTA